MSLFELDGSENIQFIEGEAVDFYHELDDDGNVMPRETPLELDDDYIHVDEGGNLTLTDAANVVSTADAFGIGGDSITPSRIEPAANTVKDGTEYGDPDDLTTGSYEGGGGGTGSDSSIPIGPHWRP